EIWLHLWRTQLAALLLNTAALVVGVGAGALLLGTALAWLVVHHRFPGRTIFEWALILPLAIPGYVFAFVFLGMFDFAGPVQTALRRSLGTWARLPDVGPYASVVVVMTLAFYPYVYLLARAAFLEQGAATLETARALGRSPWRAFYEVTLPLARPSIVAGTALAMMEALADFGTVATFGYRTLTEGVYRVWHGMFDRTAATQLAALLLLAALGLLVLEHSLRGRARFTQNQRRGPGVVLRPLAGLPAAAAVAACTALVGVAFVLPVAQLVVWAAGAGGPARIGAALAPHLGVTVTLAAVTAVATCAIGLVLAYARRLCPSRPVRVATRMAAMGYAVPGAVIAVGVLTPLAWLDRALDAAAHVGLARPLALILTGSLAGLLFAYVVRFVAVGFQTLDASLSALPPSLDEASRSLGARVGAVLRRVHLPLLRRGLLTAMALVFVETIKELPATLLLRPLGVTTLAVDVWTRTSESLWAEAALPGLAIVLAGVGPVILTMRASAAARRER
ncbi:MAG TPA: iron ABC transporter permease, partial [Methylomirabilota bacterium]|nr:iron ABC transporter permease [Methylomirabilota bacterium]